MIVFEQGNVISFTQTECLSQQKYFHVKTIPLSLHTKFLHTFTVFMDCN